MTETFFRQLFLFLLAIPHMPYAQVGARPTAGADQITVERRQLSPSNTVSQKGNFDYWINRGRAEESGMDDEAALASYNHCLELVPDDPYTLWRRSKIFVNLNRRSDAKADLVKVIKLTGNLEKKTTRGAIDANAGVSLAELLSKEGSDKEAISLLDKTFACSGDRTALFVKSEIEIKQRHYDSAMKTVNAALGGRPDNLRSLETKAICLMHLGNLKGSEKAFTEALAIAKEKGNKSIRVLWRLYDERAALYRLMGKNDLAERDNKEKTAGRDSYFDIAPFRTKAGE